MAQINDFECYRGEAVTITFTMNPVPVGGISGWSIMFTLKEDATDVAALLSVAGVITDAADGIFTVSLTHAQTTQAAGDYAYDVWRTNALAETELSIGTFTIKQDVLY